MKIIYKEFCTHIAAEIDLTTSREYCGNVMADAYCKHYNKRKTEKVKEYFSRDCGMFHFVRDILEDIETPDFSTVVQKFAELYPTFHEDWKSALSCGLLVKARETIEYQNDPYIYQDETAAEIREAGINGLVPIIKAILEKQPA